MSCKVLLLRLHRSGLITLPEPRHINSNGKKSSRRTEQGESKENIDGPLPSLLPLELKRVVSKKDSFLWNELIDRYHYLGYTPFAGRPDPVFDQLSGRLSLRYRLFCRGLEGGAQGCLDWLEYRAPGAESASGCR